MFKLLPKYKIVEVSNGMDRTTFDPMVRVPILFFCYFHIRGDGDTHWDGDYSKLFYNYQEALSAIEACKERIRNKYTCTRCID